MIGGPQTRSDARAGSKRPGIFTKQEEIVRLLQSKPTNSERGSRNNVASNNKLQATFNKERDDLHWLALVIIGDAKLAKQSVVNASRLISTYVGVLRGVVSRKKQRAHTGHLSLEPVIILLTRFRHMKYESHTHRNESSNMFGLQTPRAIRKGAKCRSLQVVAVCASIVAILITTACSSNTHAVASRPEPEVATVTINSETVVLSTELPGRTSSYLVAEIRPQVSGVIQSRLFREGSNVKAGDPLYQIDPAPYNAAYSQAKSALATAEAELATAQANLPAIRLRAQRLKGLAEIHAVGQQDYDDASAALQQAEATVQARNAAVETSRAAVETARINLSYTPIKAPISGRIGISNVTVGAMATAYQPTPLAVIQKLDPIYVDVVQANAQVLRLRQQLEAGRLKRSGAVEKKAKLILEDGTPYSKEGTLQFRDVTVDPATGSVTLRLIFPNPDQVLLPGTFVRAVVQEGVSDQALLVPQQGVTRDTKGKAVAWVVNKDDKIEQRTLELNRAIGNKWLVTSGLAAGERLVVEGFQKARPGDRVRVVAFTPGPSERATTNAGQNRPEGGR